MTTVAGAVALLAGVATPMVLDAAPAGATTSCPAPVITGTTAVVTCSYNGTTGADGTGQTWTVPPGVTQATFDVFGAQGGSNLGGLGGETKAVLSVTPGATLSVVVAGQGEDFFAGAQGGFGGGGAGASASFPPGGGGGGGSSVTAGSTLLLAAGGGGGGADCYSLFSARGGSGGGLSGTPGQAAGLSQSFTGGAPGTQAGGGVATGNATSGGAGQGGAAGTDSPCNTVAEAGGGGGGYFGGAGGDNGTGGGGGSGFAEAGVTPTFNTGVQSGNGVVTITYTVPPPCPAPVITGNSAVVTCSYNGTTGADGTSQTWTVPPGVTQATFDVFGAQGGGSRVGGPGGETKAVVPVTPGATLSVVVAGMGEGFFAGALGGFGGGGAGGSGSFPGGGGGGGSSVTAGSTLLLAAGGGGGGANCLSSFSATGGSGGGLSGTQGQAAGLSQSFTGGAPGTQAGGGVATGNATSGGAGQGGAGGTDNPCNTIAEGGGGGGGYFGGAGGDNGTGGGGGSGFAEVGVIPTFNTGVQSSNGVVTITYTLPSTTSTTAVDVTGSTVVGSGGTLSDTLTVTGTSGGPTPTNTAGGVDFYVCQVSTSSTLAPGVCPATGTPFDATEILQGSGDTATATSNPFTPTGAGTWCFSATYAGDSNYPGSADNTTVIDANECALISPASPSLTTTPNTTSVTIGPSPTTLKDTAALSGGYSPKGMITFTLYHGATLVDTETATVTGNGSYTTPTGYTLPTSGTVSGTYQWDASYSGDINNNGVSDNNATNEQVSVASPCANLTTYFLSASSNAGNFTGLFCVNANGDGTYVQYPSSPHTSGPGHVKKNQGVTTIQASGPTAREFSLVGQTNGTTSSYNETGYGLPRKTGTFTLVKGPA